MQGDFRIDGWLVQPQVNSIEKDGKVWHLEPKIMQVLVELALHPDEVLSKDRLLGTVWRNTFVGEDVLVRCISEIRSVFGDVPKSSRVIQTIPKAGYRLIAPVTPHPLSSAEASVSGTDKPGSSGVRIQPSPIAIPHTYDFCDENPHPAYPSKAFPSSACVTPLELDNDKSMLLLATGNGSADDCETPIVQDNPFRCRHVKIISAVVSFVALLAYVGLFYSWNSTHRSALDWFWDPVFSGGDPLLVCIGDQLQNSQLSLRDASDPKRLVPLKDTLATIALDDMSTIMRVDRVLQSHHTLHSWKAEGATNLVDLRSGATIFIGAFDNAWTLRLTRALRFHFLNNADMSRLSIVDANNPGQTHWLVDRTALMVDNDYRDYSIIARFTDPITGKIAVIIGGIGSGGTIAGGEYVSDFSSLDQLRRAAQAAGNKKNMEVVLSTQVIDGQPGSAKIEAAYFW